MGGGTILLSLRHSAKHSPLPLGFSSWEESKALALITLMVVTLYVSGYFKPLAKTQPSALERNDLSFFLPVKARKSQRIVVIWPVRCTRRYTQTRQRGAHSLRPNLKPDRHFYSVHLNNRKNKNAISFPYTELGKYAFCLHVARLNTICIAGGLN